MKKILLLLSVFLLFFTLNIQAQQNLKEKRIYLVDVTASMVGKGVEKTPNIFSTVKENLVTTINHIEDQRTEIVIVPFTTKPLGFTSNTVFHKDSLTNVVRQLCINKGDTNIADAWTYGVSLVDSTKVNYIFLLTDGLHNYGPSKEDLYSRLREWGNLSDGKNMFAFYVMLTPNAKESTICNIVDETKNLWLIESMDIDASLVKTSPVIKKNVFKDKRFSVYFESNNHNVALNDLGLKFEIENNKYYQIGQAYPSMVSTTMMNFDMKEIIGKKEIPLVDTLSLKISFDKVKYPFVFITPEYVNLIVANQGERKVWLSQNEFEQSQETSIYFGKVKYKEPFRGPFKLARKILEPTLDYPPFSWVKSDTACTLNPIFLSFNEEAIRAKSCISFELRDEYNNKIETISSNLDSTIIAINEKQPITFKIKVLPDFPTGDVSGNYYVKSNNIDYFNDEQCTTGFDNMGTWNITYKKPWPIILWLLWIITFIIIICTIGLILYILFKGLVYLIFRPLFAFANAGSIQKSIFVLYNLPTGLFHMAYNFLPRKMQSFLKMNMPRIEDFKTGEFIPNNDQQKIILKEMIKETGKKIYYKNGEIDFEPVAKYKVKLHGSLDNNISKTLNPRNKVSEAQEYARDIMIKTSKGKKIIEEYVNKYSDGNHLPIQEAYTAWKDDSYNFGKSHHNPLTPHETIDGKYILWIPKKYHDVAYGGIAHNGGVSLLKSIRVLLSK